MAVGRDEHARRRVAGLAAVAEAARNTARDDFVQVRVVEDHVGRLAPQLLRDALDRGRGSCRHLDAGPRGTGERHHVDSGVRAQRLPHGGPVAVDQVVHAGRHPGFVEHTCEQVAAERSDLAGLQHHRTAGGERRGDLADDLVDRPVPRGDQTAHADRLADDTRRAAVVLELEVLQGLDRRVEMRRARGRLRFPREADRCSHLVRDRRGDLVVVHLVGNEDTPQQIQSLLARGPRVRFERRTCGLDGAVDISRATQQDRADAFLGRRVHHLELPGLSRLDPLAVDIEPLEFVHLPSFHPTQHPHPGSDPHCCISHRGV